MKVTLVNPPYPQNAHSHPPFIPLGIAYLGAVCEKAGHKVTVIDCQAERLTYDSFRKRLEQTDFNVVGVTATTLLYKSALQITTIAKEVRPECTTVIGGSHASFGMKTP
jgi:anaerobic magnesium-protoporphyrin IX monomethyl ester cyclase